MTLQTKVEVSEGSDDVDIEFSSDEDDHHKADKYNKPVYHA